MDAEPTLPTGQARVPDLDFVPTSAALIERAVARFADNPLIITAAGPVTYAEIDRASRRFAKRLVLMGVGKGSRVAARLPNGPEWVVAWLAVTRIGGFFLPLNSAYRPAETRKCLRIGDAELLISPATMLGRPQRQFVEEALGAPLPNGDEPLRLIGLPYLRRVLFVTFGEEEAGAIDLSASGRPDDATIDDALLDAIQGEVTPADWMFSIFTSGTTSDPKCVVHTHGGPIRHGTAIVSVQQWQAHDRIFCGMPFFWVGGNCYTLIPAMLVGAALLCMDKFDADAALDLMEREGATRFTGWPGVLNPLLAHPTLAQRAIPVMDDPLFSPRLGHTTGLGMSETGSNHTLFHVADRALPQAKGSLGRPDPMLDHRIVDPDTGTVLPEGQVGNIQVRGYSLMAGLYKREREEVFTADGYYDTRDKGAIRDGFLFFAGRDIGVIKTAGNNVSAQEVELALKALPQVAEAHVIGLPDRDRGQIVAAAVVPAAGAPAEAAAIRRALKDQLSNFKIPDRIRFISHDEVPLLATGKLDHRRLLEMLAA